MRALSVLAHPHRLRLIAALAGGRQYVSQLARAVGLSRPLVHMHLQRLAEAGLVSGQLELSAEGRAKKFFEVSAFAFHLTPETITAAARTLSEDGRRDAPERDGSGSAV